MPASAKVRAAGSGDPDSAIPSIRLIGVPGLSCGAPEPFISDEWPPIPPSGNSSRISSRTPADSLCAGQAPWLLSVFAGASAPRHGGVKAASTFVSSDETLQVSPAVFTTPPGREQQTHDGQTSNLRASDELRGGALGVRQGSPTGTISGRVTSGTGSLPGVTVTATSPALQGSRVAVSSDNGDFILPVLPPGTYKVTFELQGFRTAEHSANLGAGQTVPLDIAMTVAGTAETVNVTGTLENFAQLAAVSTSYKAADIAALPSDRTLNATVLLAPGVSSTGPSTNSQDSSTQAITIAGAMSFENLFLVNGVVLNENIRGQAVPLFIEDAVQETTVTSGAVSAEFGRFSGGVVNAVTKSGGNDFSGSFRTTFTNDSWRELTPHPNDTKVDDVVPAYEFTAGGPVARDRLWFFGAGRVVRSGRGAADHHDEHPVHAARGRAQIRRQADVRAEPQPHHARQLHLPQPRSDQHIVVHHPRPAEPLQQVAARRPAIDQLHRRAVAPLLRGGHVLEPQPEIRQQRRVHHRRHRWHAGHRSGARIALLVADLLRCLRARRGTQQPEHRCQGDLLRFDAPDRLPQRGVRVRHLQRCPAG